MVTEFTCRDVCVFFLNSPYSSNFIAYTCINSSKVIVFISLCTRSKYSCTIVNNVKPVLTTAKLFLELLLPLAYMLLLVLSSLE